LLVEAPIWLAAAAYQRVLKNAQGTTPWMSRLGSADAVSNTGGFFNNLFQAALHMGRDTVRSRLKDGCRQNWPPYIAIKMTGKLTGLAPMGRQFQALIPGSFLRFIGYGPGENVEQPCLG